MTLMSDTWIITQSVMHGMITPFADSQKRVDASGNKVLSYGVSSYGYDTRAAPEWKLCRSMSEFSYPSTNYLDPKNHQDRLWEDTVYADSFIIPPHGFALTRSVEYFKIPENVLCVVLGKSTYARLGVIVNVTPLEPGWEGHITIEITNSTPLPVRVYGNEGIAQVLFFTGDHVPPITYADKGGKYQYQEGIVMASMLS